jgi:PKD repeat protein
MQNPTNVTWNTAGTYAISLTVSNSKGSNTQTRTAYITIMPALAVDAIPVVQGFENATLASDGWTLENGGNTSTWQRITSSKRSGTACFRINHFNGTTSGDIDAFYSKSYNLTNIQKPVITFYTAYAQKAAGVNDVLKLMVSADCGQTWQTKMSKAGSTLAGGVAINAASYVPAATDWLLWNYDLSAYANSSNIRFRFESTSREGNNLYIDDINVQNAATGLNIPSNASSIGLQVTPNPFTQTTAMKFSLEKAAIVNIHIYDLLGHEIIYIGDQKFESGEFSLPVSSSELVNLSGSIYFVRVTVDGVSYSQKFVKL